MHGCETFKFKQYLSLDHREGPRFALLVFAPLRSISLPADDRMDTNRAMDKHNGVPPVSFSQSVDSARIIRAENDSSPQMNIYELRRVISLFAEPAVIRTWAKAQVDCPGTTPRRRGSKSPEAAPHLGTTTLEFEPKGNRKRENLLPIVLSFSSFYGEITAIFRNQSSFEALEPLHGSPC